ncbi:MAG: uracil-DNA glycosylase [Lactobacillales bacterium]|jgi:DNA polymerase|nr:uracil-DNA glycosylase [Lactobacillales bacterium]
MNHLQKLKWFLSAGISEIISEVPVNRLKAVEETIEDTPAQATVPPAEAPVSFSKEIVSQKAIETAAAADTLDALQKALDSFTDCPLSKTATHALIGRGALNPAVMIIGDMPDAADDKKGQVFSGETGALLERMLKAIDLDLNKNAYATNLIPWRPPGNRRPTDGEIAGCLPFLKREIHLVKPRCLLLFGNLTAEVLLGITTVAKARGAWHPFTNGDTDIPALVTFHPTNVLKMPTHRKFVWEDLKKVQEKINSEPTP